VKDARGRKVLSMASQRSSNSKAPQRGSAAAEAIEASATIPAAERIAAHQLFQEIFHATASRSVHIPETLAGTPLHRDRLLAEDC
jgi:hypothetical protein